MFRRDAQGFVEAYHAAWVDRRNGTIIEHFGKIGTYGEKTTHDRALNMSDREKIEAIPSDSRDNYFAELVSKDFSKLTVQFKFNPFFADTINDAKEMRLRMRRAIDDVISWTGLGKSTRVKCKHDTMKILFDVTDFEMASTTIHEILKDIPIPEYEIVRNCK